MKTVSQVSALTGVSVRTLHHYDAIGLLKPSRVTESGYRYYDEGALRRLQQILLFRELDFSLKEIRDILDRPDYDPQAALRQQIRLLELRRERLDRILSSARELEQKGWSKMGFSAFDRKEMDDYAAEAKARWGDTEAYKAYEAKSAAEGADPAEGLMAIFARFGEIRSQKPDSAAAQALVGELQSYITGHFYPCEKPILASLGQMYTGDARFRQNIDARGGEGTAQFASDAISVFCQAK